MKNALKNNCNGYPKLVINFEVDYDASPYIVKKYLDSRDYQNNLVKELKILEKNGDIELVSIKKFKYSVSPVNRSSAIMWKPKLNKLTKAISIVGTKVVGVGKGLGTSAKNISKGSVDKVKKLNPFSKKEK